jgi:hypothetical protein
MPLPSSKLRGPKSDVFCAAPTVLMRTACAVLSQRRENLLRFRG